MLKSQIKKQIKKLHQKKYRYEFREFLVEGVKGVHEAIDNANVLVMVVEGSRRDEKQLQSLITLATKKDIPIEYCGRKDIGDIKTTDTFPGVQAIVEMPEIDINDMLDQTPILFLEKVKDPGNLGTIIRTADWFGIKHIILSEESADPYNEKTVRSTMGSIFRTNILNKENSSRVLGMLKDDGYDIYGLDMKGDNIHKLKAKQKSVYVFGSESQGLSKEMITYIDKTLVIPGKGNAESLNLAISAGIVMSHITK